MHTYEILDDGGKVINTIVADASFVEAHFPGRHRASDAHVVTPSQPAMVVTGIVADADHAGSTLVSDMTSVTCPMGATLTVSAELRDHTGNVLPLSDSFRMPLRARDGREKVILAHVENGIATINAPMRESGVWIVSDESINKGLPSEMKMAFAGMTIYVFEA